MIMSKARIEELRCAAYKEMLDEIEALQQEVKRLTRWQTEAKKVIKVSAAIGMDCDDCFCDIHMCNGHVYTCDGIILAELDRRAEEAAE